MKAGDRIWPGKGISTEVKLNGEVNLLIRHESDIMGIITDVASPAKKKAA